MQPLSADATMFFAQSKLKKTASKVAQKYLIFSSILSWAAQMVQTEEFMFQNVAYIPTVYKTGPLQRCWGGTLFLQNRFSAM